MNKIIKTKKRSVNSKKLFQEINEFVEEAIEVVAIRWDSSIYRDSFVDLLEGWMEDELVTAEKITQFSIVCDNRNNSSINMKHKKFSLIVKYKQKNCLNTTSIEYTIDGRTAIEALPPRTYP